MTYLQTKLPRKPSNVNMYTLNILFVEKLFWYVGFTQSIIIHSYHRSGCLLNKLKTRLNKYFMINIVTLVYDKILLVAKLFGKKMEERNNAYTKCKLGILMLSQLVSIFCFMRIITKSTNNVNLIVLWILSSVKDIFMI